MALARGPPRGCGARRARRRHAASAPPLPRRRPLRRAARASLGDGGPQDAARLKAMMQGMLSGGALPAAEAALGASAAAASAAASASVASSGSSPPSASASASAPGLRLFLDSASSADWAEWLPTGMFVGVTTNPTLLERAGRGCTAAACAELARDALRSPHVEEVMLQAWGESAGRMVLVGEQLAAVDRKRVVVKVPATREGLRAAATLVQVGVRVCLTAVYSPTQMLAAIGVGAEYAAPYVGRMADAGRDGVAAAGAMREAQRACGAATRVLVASVRDREQIEALMATHGCDTFTISPDAAAALLDDELSTRDAAAFEEAAGRGGAAADIANLERLDDDTNFEMPPFSQ